ncbi:MAG: hypothetical protein HY209_04110 [Candidatus Omnitrophica bacterium]|nr:hypothetical protein [Candidatus Omnitrophota bacterium]
MLFKIMLFLTGFLLVVVGLEMVIKNWAALAVLFKASAGVILALGGMVMMFTVTLRR